MKRFYAGLLIGLLVGLILVTTTFALAAPDTIKLIINGQEIKCDVPPRMIDGRVMVPARYVAEPLGAKVSWDGNKNAVIITSNNGANGTTTITNSSNNSLNYNNLISAKELHDNYGARITIPSTSGAMFVKINDLTIEISQTQLLSLHSTGKINAEIKKNGKQISTINIYEVNGALYFDRKLLSFI